MVGYRLPDVPVQQREFLSDVLVGFLAVKLHR